MEYLIRMATVLLSSYVVSGCFYERPFGYPARISQQGDIPCFAIANNRETRRAPLAVAAVSVHSYGADRTLREGPAKEIWRHGYLYDKPPYKDTSYFITPEQCIIYNDDGNAPVLGAGEKYKVGINTYIKQVWSGESRFFYAYFCLNKDQSGNAVVHQVEWDDHKGARNWDICW